MVLAEVLLKYTDAGSPRRICGIVGGLRYGIFVDVDGGNQSIRALGQHEGNESGTGADIEYVAGLGYVCPGSQQYAVGANFHGTAVVVYGELLETEKWIGHFGSYEL
jgi:hypothetical protein